MSAPTGRGAVGSAQHQVSSSSSTSASASATPPLQTVRPLGLVRHTAHLLHPQNATQIVGTGTAVVGAIGSAGTAILQGAQIVNRATRDGASSARPPSTAVRLLSPLNLQTLPLQQHGQHVTIAAQKSLTPSQTATATAAKQIASYHVPRGAAAVASLSVPRAAAAPRVTTPAPDTGWSAAGAQIRSGALVYAPRSARPTAPQATTAQRPAAALRQATPQTVLQTATPVRTTTKVVPIIQRNFQSAKVVGVATLGVRPTVSPRTVSGAYFYEVSSGPNAVPSQIPTAVARSTSPTAPTRSTPVVTAAPSASTPDTFAASGNSDRARVAGSPPGPQRPSILRKRENESNSPVKSQWAATASPPPSPGGSTTVSAASSPELDDEESSLPSTPVSQPQSLLPSFNNCSPRKKPRKQLLGSESRANRGSECEFPSEGGRAPAAPSPPPAAIPPPAPAPPEVEKPPPRRAMLGAGWRCGWRANALHFMRPTDVRKKEERRPSVVEIAAQRQVLQKANGWKVHHLTAQMEDLIELESEALQQATEALRVMENCSQSDLHQICELLKGNIQRSKFVCEGVAEARNNVLRLFQHKPHVSDILARQADKRCFKKHRNQ